MATKIQSGLAFHVHHDVLMEYCTDYEERVNYIKEHKPQSEQEIRLRLFQLIPSARLPPPLVKAGKAYYKAREACVKAGETYVKAWEAYDKAWEAYEPQIVELHKELCPDCPWDGETIFPQSTAK